MDDRLLVPATRALLEGWVGPVLAFGLWRCEAAVLVACEDHVYRLYAPGAGAYAMPLAPRRSGNPLDLVERPSIALDLSRAECRDRVARVLADVLWPDFDRTGPLAGRFFADWTQSRARWTLEIEVTRHDATGLRHGSNVGESWDLGLDPHDDTRLPDGSRLVDALALAAVAREVLRG